MPINPLAPRPVAIPKAEPDRTLRPGTHGNDVKHLQQTLAALGYDVGTADGAFGPATQKALQAFQRANGLAADGVLGARSRAALLAAPLPPSETPTNAAAVPKTTPPVDARRLAQQAEADARTRVTANAPAATPSATAPVAPVTTPDGLKTQNVDASFPNLTAGSDGPPGKKGKDFMQATRADGTTATLSFNASAHSDYDGGGVTGGADGTTQASTTYKFPDGKSVDPTAFSSYVLPCQTSVTWKDKKGKWHSGEPPAHSDPAAPAITGAKSPFHDAGVRPLDLARITTPQGGTAYAVLADAGPSFAIGEISPKAATASNLQASMPKGETWGPNCGFDMTEKNGAVNYNIFPGSGDAVSRLYKAKAATGAAFTDADIQRLGALAESRAAAGKPITDEEIATLAKE